jgi:Flp pilus assembly pilin Flp
MNLMRQFWQDEAGVIVSTEIILIAMLLVFGLIAGLVSLRDAVGQELGDTGAMVNSLNQTYSFLGHTNTAEGSINGATPSSSFADLLDENNVDQAGLPTEGMTLIGVAVAAET